MSDEAIPAATLIVVRDTVAGPPQLLMVERAEGMAFVALPCSRSERCRLRAHWGVNLLGGRQLGQIATGQLLHAFDPVANGVDVQVQRLRGPRP